MTMLELLKLVEQYGGRIEVAAGQLHLVRPTGEFERKSLDTLLPELREKRDAILAHYQDPDTLTQEQVNQREIIALMYDADKWFATTGVGGTHPEVIAAVDVIYAAYEFADLETVKLAITEFKVAVRRLVNPKVDITLEMVATENEDGIHDLDH